jgi:hypothetical protein
LEIITKLHIYELHGDTYEEVGLSR